MNSFEITTKDSRSFEYLKKNNSKWSVPNELLDIYFYDFV